MKESFLEINTDNLISNFQWYKNQSASGFVCPMIKANAYGVGEEIVFKTLRKAGADYFGVVRLSEAKSVRRLDSNVNILLFNPCDEFDFQSVVDLRITPVISSMQAIKTLTQVLETKSRSDFEIHLEIDTGMNRLGFRNESLDSLFEFLKKNKSLKISGLFSHFLKADDWPEPKGKSYLQLKRFEAVVSRFKEFFKHETRVLAKTGLQIHLSSSKGLNDLGLKAEYNKDLIKFGLRPGLGLFGLSQNNVHLKPVLTLKAPIIDLKWIEPGETVSYDGIWTAEKRTLLGVLPIGYGDGYPRALAEKSYVLVKGQKVPVVGKICMDFMMIDLTNLSFQTKASDLSKNLLDELSSELAIVFGAGPKNEHLSIELLSEWAGFITYEFIVRLSSRLQRIAVGN